MRKRFKYLSHLPLSCDIVLCEIYLNDIVSSATFKKFKRNNYSFIVVVVVVITILYIYIDKFIHIYILFLNIFIKNKNKYS